MFIILHEDNITIMQYIMYGIVLHYRTKLFYSYDNDVLLITL
jgi:hypothetical protein